MEAKLRHSKFSERQFQTDAAQWYDENGAYAHLQVRKPRLYIRAAIELKAFRCPVAILPLPCGKMAEWRNAENRYGHSL
jgi:hypothetical protein